LLQKKIYYLIETKRLDRNIDEYTADELHQMWIDYLRAPEDPVVIELYLAARTAYVREEYRKSTYQKYHPFFRQMIGCANTPKRFNQSCKM